MESCKYKCKNGKIYLEGSRSFVDCPDCGQTAVNEIKEAKSGVLRERYATAGIPAIYQDVSYGHFTNMLKHPMLVKAYEPTSVARVQNALEGLLQGAYNKELPQSSLYIHLPFFVEVEQFVYLFQKVALDACLSCVPYITLNALNGLTHSSDYGVASMKGVELNEYSNPEILDCIDGCKLANEYKMTYSDFIQADVCILHASANTTQRGFNALADILGERSRRGKATIVLGYWGSRNKNVATLNYLLTDSFSLNKKRGLEVVEVVANGNDTSTAMSSQKAKQKAVPSLKEFSI